MAKLVRWSPLSDLMSLHSAMDRLFGDTAQARMSTGRTVAAVGTRYLPLDVYQTDNDCSSMQAARGTGAGMPSSNPPETWTSPRPVPGTETSSWTRRPSAP
jgi:hypothetical protein